MKLHHTSTNTQSPTAAPDPTFRSAAVARMAGMPVATLRIWEQRYAAVQPGTAPSGHRLYSPADVQRVLLLRQLTEQGHAIGSIAALDSAQLAHLEDTSQHAGAVTASRHAHTQVARTQEHGRAKRALRCVVVGQALAARLQRPAVARQLRHGMQQVALFETLTEAADATFAKGADLLLWHAPELQPEVPPDLLSAQRACKAQRLAVVYRFAGSTATRALAKANAAALREPSDDEALGSWLAALEAGLSARPGKPKAPGKARVADKQAQRHAKVPPRRYDDATLTAIAGLSPTLACECPRHVAELLMQLSSFEAYSAACINRSQADAQLHTYLQQVAGASRALFESALERVARHEGLPLSRP